MKNASPHQREAYRKVCTKALSLKEGADWNAISRMRSAIKLSAAKTANDIEHHDPNGYRQLIQTERERRHGVFLFSLDPNSTDAEVERFSKISELNEKSENRKREVAAIFRLPEDTGWYKIQQLFDYMKGMVSKQPIEDRSVEERMCEYLNIPREFYKGLVEIIELGGDLEELERV